MTSSRVFQVSRRVEYALRAAVFLCSLPPGEVVSFKEIATNQQVPKDFLAKILRSLVDAGLVRSVRGPSGGFGLARDPSEISFLDVIIAADGPIAINNCCEFGDGCDHVSRCSMKSVWRRGEAAMLEVFRRTPLSDLNDPSYVRAFNGEAVLTLGTA